MSKLSNRVGYRACLFLMVVGFVSGAGLAPAGRVSAQVAGSGSHVTGFLNTPRASHTATLLLNGKVLVAGGWGPGNVMLKSAELYDPVTGRWTETGSLDSPRYGHQAVLLVDGKVLVVGGWHFRLPPERQTSVQSMELYDPGTGSWSRVGELAVRGVVAATLLPNGRVLIIGGNSEIYDPTTGTLKPAARLSFFRDISTPTLLPNGKILFSGVASSGDISINPGRAALYDSVTGTWSLTGNPAIPRYWHSQTLLPDGRVLVSGGVSWGISSTRNAEIYDPETGSWSTTGGFNYPHENSEGRQTATLTHDGKVLVTGGFNYDVDYFPLAESYDPALASWHEYGGLSALRSGHTATLLANGRILIAGGANYEHFISSAELFDPGLPEPGPVVSVSAAGFGLLGLAGETIASAFGSNLATASAAAPGLPLPTQLAGTSLRIKDSAGVERLAPLFFVSPSQVNYLIPEGTAAGVATVTITSGEGRVSTGTAIIRAVAPSLFTANSTGEGLAAALALRVKADGTQSYEPVAELDEDLNRFIARPIDLGPEGERVYLVLFGTGIRHRRALSSVIAAIGGEYAEVTFAGAHDEYVGVDQVNLLLPRSLSGRGEVEVLLTVEAQLANPVRLQIK
jgi:uncharacterized protein (TIGR03437 family)